VLSRTTICRIPDSHRETDSSSSYVATKSDDAECPDGVVRKDAGR